MSTPSTPDESADDRWRLPVDTLAGSLVILLVMTALQRLIGFGRGILFCRWLSPDELGRWDMVFGFLMLAAPVAVLGLPGSFGRYVEHYRQRGQLAVFLRRTTLFVVCSGFLAVAFLWLAAPWIGDLIVGDAGQTELVGLTALCLAAVIVQSYLTSLFTALRRYRIAAGLQFATAVLFAVIAILLLMTWRLDAMSVVAAFGAASLLASAAAIPWVRRIWRAIPDASAVVSQRTFWAKLMPFALWVWATNWLANLFQIADRYMIIHYSGLDSQGALELVGQYHSARIVPLLFVGVAELLGALVMPHLSHDWEAGRRGHVVRNLNLTLKLFAFAMLVGSVVVLAAAPLLFGVAFLGKYSGGLSVLPLTLTLCAWTGIACVAQSYLWCAEKARLGSLALAAGLIVNVGLNLVLLPLLGLEGAVLATAVGMLTVLLVVLFANARLGMPTDLGLGLVIAAPVLLYWGVWPATAAVVAIALGAVFSRKMFTTEERVIVTAALHGCMERVAVFRKRAKTAAV